MNCDRCPHMKRIRAALAPCQLCEAGKLHGQVRANGETFDWAMKQRVAQTHGQRASVTPLDPDAEDTFREALMQMFDLDPVELLLVQHVMRGGSYASFAAPLAQMLRRLRTKEAELEGRKPGFRSLAHTWAKKIAEKAPVLATLLKARTEGEM